MDHAFEALNEDVADEDLRQELEKNYQLTKAVLGNLPKRPRGKCQIDLTFEVDRNGVFHLSAKAEDG